MTTDHDLIARACRRVGLEELSPHLPGPPCAYVVEFDDGRDWCGMSTDNPALHTLLVWRLAKALAARPYAWSEGDTEPTCIVLSTGGHGWCIWRETPDGLEIGLDKENAGELKEPIDIIRVLVGALEGGG